MFNLMFSVMGESMICRWLSSDIQGEERNSGKDEGES